MQHALLAVPGFDPSISSGVVRPVSPQGRTVYRPPVKGEVAFPERAQHVSRSLESAR